jgi:hypothetical protein
VNDVRMQAHHISLESSSRATRISPEKVQGSLVDPVWIGGKGAGPVVRDPVPDEDDLRRGGFVGSAWTDEVGSGLSVGADGVTKHRDTEQTRLAFAWNAWSFHAASWAAMGGPGLR